MTRLIALVTLSPVLFAQTIEFHYAPKDGVTCVETTTSRRTMDNGPTKMDDEVTISATSTIHKTPQGYAITRIVETKNGNQFESAMNGAPITWSVDSTGHFQGVSGYEKPLADFKAKLPAKSQMQVDDALTPQTLSARDRREWDGRIGRFAGKTFELGKSVVEDGEMPGPDNEMMSVKTTSTVTAMADCPAGECARVRVTTRTPEGAPVQMETITEMIIDPITGLLYNESISRNAKVKQVSILEKRDTNFAYR